MSDDAQQYEHAGGLDHLWFTGLSLAHRDTAERTAMILGIAHMVGRRRWYAPWTKRRNVERVALLLETLMINQLADVARTIDAHPVYGLNPRTGNDDDE